MHWKYWGGIWKHPDGLSVLTADNGSTYSSIPAQATSNTSKTVRSAASPSSFESQSKMGRFRRSLRTRRIEDGLEAARPGRGLPFTNLLGEARIKGIVYSFSLQCCQSACPTKNGPSD